MTPRSLAAAWIWAHVSSSTGMPSRRRSASGAPRARPEPGSRSNPGRAAPSSPTRTARRPACRSPRAAGSAHVEADHQRAVGEDARARARGAGAGDDAAQDLDGERQAVALVVAAASRRAAADRRRTPRDRCAAARPESMNQPGRRLLASCSSSRGSCPRPPRWSRSRAPSRAPSAAGHGDRVGIGAEPPGRAAPRRDVQPVHGVRPRACRQALRSRPSRRSRRGGRRGPCSRAPPRLMPERLGLGDGHLHPAAGHHLAEAAPAVEAWPSPGVSHDGHRRGRDRPRPRSPWPRTAGCGSPRASRGRGGWRGREASRSTPRRLGARRER